MKITKVAPALATARDDLDRMFERFLGGALPMPEGKLFETVWAPPVDLTETDKEYLVRLEAPGIHKENLDINLEGNVLTLSGRREFHKEEENEEYLWREREVGKFVRSLRLPKAVQEGNVEATYNNGVLTVRLPKTETAVKARIAIK